MKSLVESLFDKDLVFKKLSIEKYMNNFSSDMLEKLDIQERNSVFDQLFESGNVMNVAKLKKTPVDLMKDLIIQKENWLKGSEINHPNKYYFIYSIRVSNKIDKIYVATLVNDFPYDGKHYSWDNYCPYIEENSTWEDKVTTFDKLATFNPNPQNCSYSVISNKKWVKNIIDGILLD